VVRCSTIEGLLRTGDFFSSISVGSTGPMLLLHLPALVETISTLDLVAPPPIVPPVTVVLWAVEMVLLLRLQRIMMVSHVATLPHPSWFERLVMIWPASKTPGLLADFPRLFHSW